MWDLSTNQMTQIAQHEQPIKFIRFVPERNIIVTGSWDKKYVIGMEKVVNLV